MGRGKVSFVVLSWFWLVLLAFWGDFAIRCLLRIVYTLVHSRKEKSSDCEIREITLKRQRNQSGSRKNNRWHQMWVTFDWFAEAIVDKSEFNVFFMQGHLWCVRWLWRHWVAFRLCFKASRCAKPLMWKSVLFTCKWTTICVWIELISTWTASH